MPPQIEPVLPGKPLENGSDHAQNTEAFKKVVSESKLKLTLEPTPEKRGRGRPRKIRVEAAAPGTASVPSGQSVVQPTPPPDISKYLIHPIVSVSKIPAHRTGIAEVAFTIEEAELCAHSLNDLLNAFVPEIGEMSPKTAAVISAVSTFGSISFQKFQIYLAKKNEVKPIPPPPPEVAPRPPGPAFPVTEAVGGPPPLPPDGISIDAYLRKT